jgi:hypothetical protein
MSGNLQVPWWKSGVTSHSKNWQIWCSPWGGDALQYLMQLVATPDTDCYFSFWPPLVQGHIILFLLATCSVYPVWDRGQYFHVRMKSVPRVNCLLLMPRSLYMHIISRFDVSKTDWMMSVSITELIWQAKTWEKSNREVGNPRFVVFQLIVFLLYCVNWVILNLLRLPLDVNRL